MTQFKCFVPDTPSFETIYSIVVASIWPRFFVTTRRYSTVYGFVPLLWGILDAVWLPALVLSPHNLSPFTIMEISINIVFAHSVSAVIGCRQFKPAQTRSG